MVETKDNGFLSSRICDTPLPGMVEFGYSITSVQGEKVVLVGGYGRYPNDGSLASVFEGSLSKTEKDVNWIKLARTQESRESHAAFNRGQKLYIVGGRRLPMGWIDSCEVYDVSKRTWSKGPSLPYALMCPKAVSDQNELFSIVLGGKDDECEKFRVFIFDHELVFKEIASSNNFLNNFPLYNINLEIVTITKIN